MKNVCIVLGGFAAFVIIALVVRWAADTAPTHKIEEENGILYVTLLRHDNIVDVVVTPSEERVHLDIYYDDGKRHVHLETSGKPILISPVRIKPVSIAADHFTDRTGAQWAPLVRGSVPPGDTTLYGAIGYVPSLDHCSFLWMANDDGTFLMAWIRQK